MKNTSIDITRKDFSWLDDTVRDFKEKEGIHEDAYLGPLFLWYQISLKKAIGQYLLQLIKDNPNEIIKTDRRTYGLEVLCRPMRYFGPDYQTGIEILKELQKKLVKAQEVSPTEDRRKRIEGIERLLEDLVECAETQPFSETSLFFEKSRDTMPKYQKLGKGHFSEVILMKNDEMTVQEKANRPYVTEPEDESTTSEGHKKAAKSFN